MHKFTRAYSITYARIRVIHGGSWCVNLNYITLFLFSILILIFCKEPTVIGVKLLWCPSFFNAIVV
jgi:hypothetical protein